MRILSTNSSDISWELKSTLLYVHAFVVEKVITAFFFRMCCSFFIWWLFMAILVYLHKRIRENLVLLRTPIVRSCFYNRFIGTIARMKCPSPWSFIIFFERKKVFFLRLAEMLWLDTKFHSNAFTERVWIFLVESFLATGWTIVGISEESRNVFPSLFLQLITELKTMYRVKCLSDICLSHFHALLSCSWFFS